MVMKFKIFSEKTKQKLGIKSSEADWKPTSNARNLAMVEEVRKFAQQLKLMHANFTELEKNITASLNTMKGVLSSPLPMVHVLSENGPVPVDAQPVLVGNGVSLDIISGTGQDLKLRLQQEVLYPLEQWLAAYRSIKARNVKCEEMRLELDAKRRLVASLAKDVEKYRSRTGGGPFPASGAAAAPGTPEGEASSNPFGQAAGGPGGPGASFNASPSFNTGGGSTGGKLEQAESRFLQEEEKVNRLAQKYQEVEREVHAALLTLIKDTEVLKQYAGAALLVYERSFRQAYTAFDAGAPLMAMNVTGGGGGGSGYGASNPSFRTTGGSTGGAPYGTWNNNTGGSSGGEMSTPTWYTDAKKGAAGGIGADSDDERR